MDLPPLKTTFHPGRHSNGVFGREDLHFEFIVLVERNNLRSVAFSMQAFEPLILACVQNVALLVFGKVVMGYINVIGQWVALVS